MNSSDPMLVHLLGTGSAAPTTKRFPSSQVLEVKQKNFLIDCGEGAQIQLRRNKIKFSRITAIFISHLHGDHCFGLPGLISTLGLLGRTADLNIYAHPDLETLMQPWFNYFTRKVNYKVVFHHINPKVHKLIYEDRGIEVYTLPLKHSVPTCGFLFKEKGKLFNIRKEIVAKYNLSIQEIVSIKAGSDLYLTSGEIIPNESLVLPPIPCRSYAYCSDTQYQETLVPLIKNVNLLYHEATFLKKDHNLAKETGHSTSEDAASIALKANVKNLVIGHFSARYDNEQDFLKESAAIFPQVKIAVDGMKIAINSDSDNLIL